MIIGFTTIVDVPGLKTLRKEFEGKKSEGKKSEGR